MLDVVGCPTPVTWTLLSQTANAGDTTINLQVPVEWKVGDEIIIATTGGHLSQNENEKMQIAAISADKMTLTLKQPLTYQHLGITETYASGSVSLEVRAEVGLLTHNIKVRGSNDPAWNDEIEACEAGFDTGICLLVCICDLS